MKYTKEILECAVKSSFSVAEVMRKLGLKSVSGTTHGYITKKIDEFGVDRSHFKRSYQNKALTNKKHWSLILVKCDIKLTSSFLRNAILESGREYICTKCGNGGTWQNEPIRLQVDHINGDVLDNTPSNVRFLCPNCHSQTETHSKVKISKFNKCDCGKRSKNKRCVECYKKDRENNIPSTEELRELVWSKPSTHIAKDFGVSDRMIGKWCVKRGITKPPPGYWKKIKT